VVVLSALAAATALAVGYGAAALISDPDPTPRTDPTPTPTPTEEPRAQDSDPPPRPRPPDVSDPNVWASWAVLHLDVEPPHLTVGGEPGTSTTESMIKVGIAADVLAGLQQHNPPREPTAWETEQLTKMIVDSDNAAAEHFYRARGGDQLVQRLIVKCGLRETRSKPGWWSETQMTAADAARLGACITDGRIVSPAWTAWILKRMREVRGVGRFGFTETRPYDHGRPLAIKNGWTLRDDGMWHVSCLAIADWWTMAALVRYPAGLGLDYGAVICADVAAALAPDDELVTPDNAETGQAPTTMAGAWPWRRAELQRPTPADSTNVAWYRDHMSRITSSPTRASPSRA
jgi:hypothetical protein